MPAGMGSGGHLYIAQKDKKSGFSGYFFESFALYSYLSKKKSQKDEVRNMLAVTDSASSALQDVLKSEQASGKHLIIFFQGYG